jgi:hypothetical protein
LRIDSASLDEMFRTVGVDKRTLYEALESMPDEAPHKSYRCLWTKDNPTRGCCFVVTQFLQFVDPTIKEEFCPYKLDIPGEPTPADHWYLRRKSDNEVIDLTAEQFCDEYTGKVANRRDREQKKAKWSTQGNRIDVARNLVIEYRSRLNSSK